MAPRARPLDFADLPGVKLVPSHDVNVYDLLGYDRVLLSQAAASFERKPRARPASGS